MQNTTARKIAFHGVIVLVLGMLAGIGFSVAAAQNLDSYGSWRFAHMEGLVNGILVIALAGVWQHLDEQRRMVQIGKWLAIIGAYCNIIGPLITALFIGHRVIEPHTPLEAFVVYGFYIPGTLPLPAFILFAIDLLGRNNNSR